MDPPSRNRKYSDEEKQQLIANLDIEVAHRTRQFQSWLADGLENFNIHQEGHVSRIPKQVRNMTMREFGDKYKGNVQAALRGVQKERFVGAGGDGALGDADKLTRKRKWVASQEAGEDNPASRLGTDVTVAATETARAAKNARLVPPSPQKKPGSSTGPGTAQRARLLATGNKTPGASHTTGPSQNPQKVKPPFNASTRPPTRPTSPSKQATSKTPQNQRQQVHLSAPSFNPAFLPPKTPVYPGAAMRLPRRDESMLSLNGSPIANPYDMGPDWFGGTERGDANDEGAEGGKEKAEANGVEADHTVKRSKSNIIIHRDVPFVPSTNGSGIHSRTNSQTSIYSTSSQTESSNHSRTNSQSTEPYSQSRLAQNPSYPSQLTSTYLHTTTTPKPLRSTHTHSVSHIASALVAIPTKDGQFIEFDPLQTSPGALDALEGITDSAKKQARVEMGRLVQAAVDKWKIG